MQITLPPILALESLAALSLELSHAVQVKTLARLGLEVLALAEPIHVSNGPKPLTPSSMQSNLKPAGGRLNEMRNYAEYFLNCQNQHTPNLKILSCKEEGPRLTTGRRLSPARGMLCSFRRTSLGQNIDHLRHLLHRRLAPSAGNLRS